MNLEGKFGLNHTFLFMPKCPVNLLGWDLLCKIRAQLNFSPKKIELTIPVNQMFLLGEAVERLMATINLPKEILDNVNPQIWDVEHPKKVIPLIPVKIEIKRGVTLPRIKQWPLSDVAVKGLQPLLDKYLENGLIEPCVSKCNMPIMEVPKPKVSKEEPTSYRFVHNLKAVNAIVEEMPAIVANPYTILNGVAPEASWFSVVDLKDAFFSIPVNREIRDIFAFIWKNSETRRDQQFRWTVLPMGSIHSPTIFAQVLGSHLDQLKSIEGTKVFQYVDDILVAADNIQQCKKATWDLLNSLGNWGYHASPSKFQYCQEQVKYLGHILRGEKTVTKSE